MSDALRLDGVAKGYNLGTQAEVRVLEAATLSVAAGEVVALVAPSGSGKSTLLHIAGLLDGADAGAVEISGEDVTGVSHRRRTTIRRHRVGFVYQFHHLLPEFNALDNVAMPLLIGGARRKGAHERGKDLLEQLGLAERLHHQPGQLSGGEQQRVAIARALANDPRLVIADEPTGNLDPATTERVFAALVRMAREEGAAVLVATHNLSLTRVMDRVVTIESGRVTEMAKA